MFTDSMNTWLKWALVGTWSVAVLAWAWAWATKLWYIPNWLEIEALCPWNDEVIEKSHRIPEPIDIEELNNIPESIEESGDISEPIDESEWNMYGDAVGFGKIVLRAPDPVAKPIIYLYPEEETLVKVQLWYPENLAHTYPKYKEWWWEVVAEKDWRLVDVNTNRNLYALYWEGYSNEDSEINEWFVVKGEDTISFLEEKLALLWLNEREAEEFIVYWLPELENNKYNLIRFKTQEEIERWMPLIVDPKPDTVIRVLMQYKALDEAIDIEEQKIVTPEREWFTVVEWWGVKDSDVR